MIRSFPSNALIAYPSKAKESVFTAPASKQVYAYNLRAANNSGGAINVGLMKKFYNPAGQTAAAGGGYGLYQYTASGPSVLDKTAEITAGTATNIFTATNNDGFIITGNSPFNLVGMTISTAVSGLTVAYNYWNGSSYTTLTTLEVPSNYASTGDVYVVFRSPKDWVAGGQTGINQNQYSIFVQATSAGASAVAINNLWVAQFLELYIGVANNGVVQLSFPDSKPLLFSGGESFIPYFSSTNAANQAGAYYSLV